MKPKRLPTPASPASPASQMAAKIIAMRHQGFSDPNIARVLRLSLVQLSTISPTQPPTTDLQPSPPSP